ncbi:hypothetical protein D3C78_185010 [compost metagenome]
MYVLDRNIVSRIKDHLNGCLADNKKDTIDDMKLIDLENNIISILPAIDESTLGRGLNINDKEHFIKSTSEELEAIKFFFEKAQTESKIFDSHEWTIEKYFEVVAMDSYSHENFIDSSKLIQKALDLYVENIKSSSTINHFDLIKKFINSFTKEDFKRGPLLHCLAFLANAGRDNCFSHMFLGRRFANKIKSNENYLDNRTYNVFMDIAFSKHVSFLKAQGISIDIELKTADDALLEVISKTAFNSSREINKNSDFNAIEYAVTIDENEFSRLSNDEYLFLEDATWNDNVHFFSQHAQLRISLNPLDKHKSYPDSDILNTDIFVYFIYVGLVEVGKLVITIKLQNYNFLFNEAYRNYDLDHGFKKDIYDVATKITNNIIEKNNNKISTLIKANFWNTSN